MADTLIVAIGSTVMTDDAIGHHVLLSLVEQKVKADFADLGMDLFRLRLFFNNHKKIIILDAVKGGEYPPGTVHCISSEEFDSKLEGKIRDVHRIGSIEALKLMQLSDKQLAKAEIIFIGISAAVIDKGLELTPEVKAAIPEAVQTTLQCLKES